MNLRWLIPVLFALPSVSFGQLVYDRTFNPDMTGSLCGLGFGGDVWVYGCFAPTLDAYDIEGNFITQVMRPGNSANDVDVDFAPEALSLAGTTVPAGTVLFIEGESGVAEIYAVDPGSGAVLATLVTAFGNSHVVGGAYHAARDTFFLVQDSSAGSTNGNLVAEVDPVTGAVLTTFSTISAGVSVSFGDLEVIQATGNLLVVSSVESTIAEFSPIGTLVQEITPPAGVTSLSGIAIDDDKGLIWVGSTNGNVWRLNGFSTIGSSYCGPAVPNSTGASAVIRAFGSDVAVENCVSLGATSLPTNQFGYFLNSLSTGAFTPPASQGVICVSGQIGRYNGQIGNSGSGGFIALALDLGATPTPQGTTSILAGQTWNFQCWFRDNNPAQTSNFTDGVTIAFQ